MTRRGALIVFVAAVNIVVSEGHAQEDKDSDRVVSEIAGKPFLAPRAFVISRKPPTKNSREHLWVAFSVPGYEPLGMVHDSNGSPKIDDQKREIVRRRGDDIVELKLEPENGYVGRAQKTFVESRCSEVGTFRTVIAGEIEGYSCLVNDQVIIEYFPVVAKSGKAIFVCRRNSATIQTTPRDDCDLIVEGRGDRVGLTLLYLDFASLPKVPRLLEAAEDFVSSRMNPVVSRPRSP